MGNCSGSRLFDLKLAQVESRKLAMQAGGVHVIQTFVSEDRSEEIQIQGRTARQGKSGSYTQILSYTEVSSFELDPDQLKSMPFMEQYRALCRARESRQLERGAEKDAALQEAGALDALSHEYFDALLASQREEAKSKLQNLHKSLATAQGMSSGKFHVVCCYDESGSMDGISWQELVHAHRTCMQKLACLGDARVSIVQFDNLAHVVLRMGTPSVAEGMALNMRGGRTHFRPALACAAQMLREGKQHFPNFVPMLIFMSDGVNEDGCCSASIQSIQQEFPDMVLHAIIFRMPDSAVLRDMVDAATEGHFHVSADGVELAETFQSIASSLEFTGKR